LYIYKRTARSLSKVVQAKAENSKF